MKINPDPLRITRDVHKPMAHKAIHLLSDDEALGELSESALFREDFPKRVAATLTEMQSDPLGVSTKCGEPSREAIDKVGEATPRLEELIRLLGNRKVESAVPLLARLWRICPLHPIRGWVGHALFEIGSNEALNILQETLRDWNQFDRHMAIKATFAQDPDMAFQRFAGFFDGDENPYIAQEILSFLRKDMILPGWPLPGPPIVDRDGRWLETCVALRREFVCGQTAREVLREAQIDLVIPMINAAIVDEKRRGVSVVPRTYRDGTLLSRYRNGAFKEVWEEIHSAGEIEGDFRLEVMEVADATMARVAENTDLIAERLRSAGWKALSPEFSDLRSAPKDSDVQIIAMIEEQTGAPIPVALHSFWMIVGGINWVWNYNTDQPRPDLGVDLPLDQMDPLLIEAPGGLLFQLTDLQKRVDAKHPELGDPFDLELAPDVYHKANISGGFPYAIQLPTRVADPIFAYEPHCLPFTDYLRLAFQWCGFPGLEKYSDRFDVRDFLERFGRADLKPF